MRELSQMTPFEVREREGCGLQRAGEMVSAAKLLDRTDAATTVEELRGIVSELITRVTGVR